MDGRGQPRELTVVVADANSVFRSGVVALLSRESDIRAIPCLSIDALLTQVAELKPQVALVDVDLAVSGGLAAIARIKLRAPATHPVAIAAAPDRELVLAAVRAGARGIIERTVHSASLARIVRRAAAGEVTLPRYVLGYILDELARVEKRVDANLALTPLSSREREVLSLIGQGRRNREIGEILSISELTVKRHVHNMLEKLRVPTRAAAVSLAVAAERRPPSEAEGQGRGSLARNQMRRRTPAWQRATGDIVREGQQDSIEGAAAALRPGARATRLRRPELTIVAPTRNEQAVVGAFIDSLDAELAGVRAELIIVDDSDDDTPAVVAERGAAAGLEVAIIHRAPGEREGGLGGAVVAGIAAARAPWVCVMDADLQHPPAEIAALRAQAAKEKSDLVIASRFLGGGSIEGLSRVRTLISRALVGLARVAFPFRLRSVSDPLTGFFLVRRSALDLAALRPHGFKILLEILIRSPKLAVSEIAFRFGQRPAGESRRRCEEVLRYLRLVLAAPPGHDGGRVFGASASSGSAVSRSTRSRWSPSRRVRLQRARRRLLATQVSSVWNFLLTERFVFRGTSPSRSFGGRASRIPRHEQPRVPPARAVAARADECLRSPSTCSRT